MKNPGSKEIDIDEIDLRKFETGDLQDMFDNYCNDDEVCRYLTFFFFSIKQHYTLSLEWSRRLTEVSYRDKRRRIIAEFNDF